MTRPSPAPGQAGIARGACRELLLNYRRSNRDEDSRRGETPQNGREMCPPKKRAMQPHERLPCCPSGGLRAHEALSPAIVALTSLPERFARINLGLTEYVRLLRSSWSSRRFGRLDTKIRRGAQGDKSRRRRRRRATLPSRRIPILAGSGTIVVIRNVGPGAAQWTAIGVAP